MVESAQEKWNVVQMIYNFGDTSICMGHKETTCLFHLVDLKTQLQDLHHHFHMK